MDISILGKHTSRVQNRTAIQAILGVEMIAPVFPFLANIFLHYVFDSFMASELSTLPKARYADDGVVHCMTWLNRIRNHILLNQQTCADHLRGVCILNLSMYKKSVKSGINPQPSVAYWKTLPIVSKIPPILLKLY